MREIEFRAWSKRVKIGKPHMIHLPIGGDYSGRDLIEDEDWKVMQFTGLKDKNGTKIFEGDILENGSVVCFRRGRFHPVYDGGNAEDEEDDFWLSEREVIGNIYQNPELLTK